MLNRRNPVWIQRARALAVQAGLVVALASLPGALTSPARAVAGGNGTLNIAITPGHPIAVTVAPSALTISPNDPSTACVTVLVRTSIHGWSLTASSAASPAPVDMTLEPAAAEGCAAPATGGATGRLGRGETVALLLNQKGSQAAAYAVRVRPSVRPRSPLTLTLTFTAEAPGAPVAQAALAFGLDASGRLAVIADGGSGTSPFAPQPPAWAPTI